LKHLFFLYLRFLLKINDPGNKMKQILKEISELAILLNDEEFTEDQRQTKWLGFPPATEGQINAAQERLKIDLPTDYIDFLKISNGLAVHSGVHPSFAPLSQIDYLKNIDEDLIDIWGTYEELADVARALAASIKVGGFNEEQYFLLIPPGDDAHQWRYWEFASWIPGESPFNDLTHYFTEVLEFLRKGAAEEGLIESDLVIDYTLRDQLFALDWENAYATAAHMFLHNKTYYYLSAAPILDLLHLMAGKLNRYEELAQLVHTGYTTNEEYKITPLVFIPYEEKARNRVDFMERKSVVDREDMPSLEKLLVKTKKQYPQMFDNEKDLVTYLLVELFQGGKAADYIQLYEINQPILTSYYHLRAAVIYALWNKVADAKLALTLYFEQAFNKMPLAPFVYPELIEVMDKDFLNTVLQKFKK
jgi:hypothetical protein